MKTSTVQPRQSLWDMAIEHCGSADAAFTMAALNQIAPTEKPLVAGQQLLTPEPFNKIVVKHYAQRQLVPATQTDLK